MRSVPSMSATIIPPSPSAPQRDIFVPVPGSQAVAVVPPPVSAPEQATNLHPKLTLPAPVVVSPPPTQIAREISPTRTGIRSRRIAEPGRAAAGFRWAGASTEHRAFGGAGNAAVVPPPVQLNGAANGKSRSGRFGKCRRRASSGSGGRRFAAASDDDWAWGGGGTAVVPPPPTISGGGAISGLGRGNRGAGLGGPMDAGSVAAPPTKTAAARRRNRHRGFQPTRIQNWHAGKRRCGLVWRCRHPVETSPD